MAALPILDNRRHRRLARPHPRRRARRHRAGAARLRAARTGRSCGPNPGAACAPAVLPAKRQLRAVSKPLWGLNPPRLREMDCSDGTLPGAQLASSGARHRALRSRRSRGEPELFADTVSDFLATSSILRPSAAGRRVTTRRPVRVEDYSERVAGGVDAETRRPETRKPNRTRRERLGCQAPRRRCPNEPGAHDDRASVAMSDAWQPRQGATPADQQSS